MGQLASTPKLVKQKSEEEKQATIREIPASELAKLKKHFEELDTDSSGFLDEGTV